MKKKLTSSSHHAQRDGYRPELKAKILKTLEEQLNEQGHQQMINTEIRLYLIFFKYMDYILCSQTWRSSTKSAKTRPGADCGSDHKLLIAKFRLKLKKVGKTTRPFRYDLNQIPHNYTVEVRNRFKGLYLIDRVPDEL